MSIPIFTCLRYKWLFCALSLISVQINATEYRPWLGNLLEFEWRNSLLYQGYPSISSGARIKKDHADDLFMDTSLSNAIPDIGLEIELRAASTRKQGGDIDQFKITGRYILMDDIAGDPLAAALGASLIQAFRHSLKDVSSFHHGKGECELFLSLGKETSFEFFWDFRWWVLGAVGVAERGSPWLRFQAAYEERIALLHEVKVLVDSLWGQGKEKLRIDGFEGYGPVQHQSIDLRCRYTYLIDFFGSASIEYSHRVYARNFPLHASCIRAELLYTFGL